MTSRLSSGRGCATRQMVLNAWPMVSISIIAVTPSNTTPTAVRRMALSVNCCMYSVMIFPAISGIRFLSKYVLISREKSSKTGNAENRVKAMVINGTSDNSVVKVRLAAICMQRSWLNRITMKRMKFRKSCQFFCMVSHLTPVKDFLISHQVQLHIIEDYIIEDMISVSRTVNHVIVMNYAKPNKLCESPCNLRMIMEKQKGTRCVPLLFNPIWLNYLFLAFTFFTG